MIIRFQALTLALALGASVAAMGCGGPETRDDRIEARAETQTDDAEHRAEMANETEEILDDHSPEAVSDADEIVEGTP